MSKSAKLSKFIKTVAIGLLSAALSQAKTKGDHAMSKAEAVEATYVHMKAAPGKEGALADLLKGSADVVRKNEPHTAQWFGLRENPASFAIIDFFPDQKGREAHFGGKVASALNKSAAESIEGGWDQGVVANVENSKVLSYALAASQEAPKIAVRVEFTAKPGQEEAIAAFLSQAGGTVRANEPATLAFYAIRINPARFAIFDAFGSEGGMGAHFGGKIAAGLKAHADEWFQGGWDKGVLSTVKNFTVLSSKL